MREDLLPDRRLSDDVPMTEWSLVYALGDRPPSTEKLWRVLVAACRQRFVGQRSIQYRFVHQVHLCHSRSAADSDATCGAGALTVSEWWAHVVGALRSPA